MKKSNELLKDIKDEELEQLLMQGGNAPALPHDNAEDHLLAFDDIPQPTKQDLETPEAAQGWAEREIVRATPRAAQEMINQLRRGNSKERMNAAEKIMAMSGIKGEGKVTNNATIIVMTESAVKKLPWARKFEEKKAAQVVEGTVLSSRVD